MKRIFLVVCCVLLMLSLFGCGAKYKDISPQHVEYTKKAIEIADKYLDYDYTAKEAYYELKDITNRENELPDVPDDDPGKTQNLVVETSVTLLQVRLLGAWGDDATYEDYQEILESRNDLAEYIGVKKR